MTRATSLFSKFFFCRMCTTNQIRQDIFFSSKWGGLYSSSFSPAELVVQLRACTRIPRHKKRYKMQIFHFLFEKLEIFHLGIGYQVKERVTNCWAGPNAGPTPESRKKRPDPGPTARIPIGRGDATEAAKRSNGSSRQFH